MPAFLVFSLWAPLAAFGDIAVGERRYGLERPGKSALLGLLAAALGIDRADEPAHLALRDGYGLAVRIDAPGTLVTDYHTAQVPPARRGRSWATRREELAGADLETVLSWREYRADAAFTVALWSRPGAPHPLTALEEALRTPAYILYLGRKACPLAAPPAPLTVDAPTLADALDGYDRHWRPRIEGLNRPKTAAARTVHADIDPDISLGPGLDARERRMRRDDVVSRRRWQFRLREERVARTAVASGEQA